MINTGPPRAAQLHFCASARWSVTRRAAWGTKCRVASRFLADLWFFMTRRLTMSAKCRVASANSMIVTVAAGRHEPRRRREAPCSRFAAAASASSSPVADSLRIGSEPQRTGPVPGLLAKSKVGKVLEGRRGSGGGLAPVKYIAPGRLFRCLSCPAAAPSRRVTSRLRLFFVVPCGAGKALKTAMQ